MSKDTIKFGVLLSILVVLIVAFFLTNGGLTLGSSDPDSDVQGVVLETQGTVTSVERSGKIVTVDVNVGAIGEEMIENWEIQLSRVALKKLSPADLTQSPDPYIVEEANLSDIQAGDTLVFVYDSKQGTDKRKKALSVMILDEEISTMF